MITADNLADYICGLVVTNDMSARDVQLTKTQFYESKSYPTFTPVGPALVLLDAGELGRFGELRLQLRVNGELRQDSTVDGDMIYRPVQALAALALFQELSAGDLVITGTPVGTALSAPPKPVQKLVGLLPDDVKWKMFFAGQAKNTKYLRDGDVVEATIGTDRQDRSRHATQRGEVRMTDDSELRSSGDRRRGANRDHRGNEACAVWRRLSCPRPLGGRLPTTACRSPR